MQNLVTSARQIPAAETISAIRPYFEKFDIEGFIEHTPDGIDLIRSVEILRGNPRSGYLNLGKGFGIEAALASGYMEAIEMATIEQPPKIEIIPLGDVNKDVPVYSAVTKACSPAGSVASGNALRPVMRGVDLLTGAEICGFCAEYYLADHPSDSDEQISTNGLASGNSVAEARLHAVYEIIERHVGSRHFRGAGDVKRLDVRDAPPAFLQAVAQIESLGGHCETFQLGRLFGVSVVQCTWVLERASEDPQPRVNFGWGAHHSLAIAAARAVSEAVQAYATRRACRNGAIPTGRMRGGRLISAASLSHLAADSTPAEEALAARLRSCRAEPCDLGFDDELVSASPVELLDRIVSEMRHSGLSHLFSWTLLPSDYPFAVVRCCVPEFRSFGD
ncbi:MAG TPA: YcaO-like family protein [Allosphingosinicella sp.]|nr:YcaO-like family protein [Allosphingosinicella sp.]